MARLVSRRLVGRDADVLRLDECACLAMDSVPGLVLVKGEAGIGKTRLTTEWTSRQRATGAVVAVGRCVEVSGEELPYAPIAILVRDLCRQFGVETVRELAGATWPGLVQVVPELDDDSDGTVRPPTPRGWLFAAVRRLCEGLGNERLFVAVIEDLHWVDASTRDLLGYLVRTLADARVLVIATVRDEPEGDAALAAFLAELVRLPTVEQIQLGRLADEEVAALAADILGQRLAGQQLRRLTTLSDGVPFLVEELLATGPEMLAEVPDRARQIMAVRLAGLSSSARTVVDAACLADAELTDRMLRQVVAPDGLDLDLALSEAVREAVLVPDPGRDGYRFRHALQRATLAEALLPADRRRWHSRWADALDAGGHYLDPLHATIAAAHHHYGAGPSGQALRACLDAAEACRRALAHTEHATLLQRALAVFDKVPEAGIAHGVDRDRLVEHTTDALRTVLDWPQAEAFVRAELARAERLGATPLRRLLLRLYLHDARMWQGTSGGPPPDLASMVTDVRAAPACTEKVLALQYLWPDVGVTDPQEAMVLADEAVAAAAEVGDRRLERTILADRASLHLLTGQIERGIAELTEMLEDPGDLTTTGMAGYLVTGYYRLGHFEEAVATAQRVRQEVGDVRAAPMTAAFPNMVSAQSLMCLGRWDEAQAAIDEALDLGLGLNTRATLESMAGALAVWRGDTDRAVRLAEAISTSQDVSPMSGWAGGYWLRAEVAAARGDHAGVRQILAPVWDRPDLDVCHEMVYRQLLVAARAEADAARLARAVRDPAALQTGCEVIAKVSEVADRINHPTPFVQTMRAYLHAEMSRFEGSDDPEPWHRALAAEPQMVYDRAWALLRLAEIQCRAGDRDQATVALREAYVIAADLGARPLVGEIDALATRARVDLGTHRPDLPAPDTDPARTFGLTEREREVLSLLCEGDTNAEIATRLFISPKTASVHVSHILTKLNATSRTHAAAIAHRLGLTA